MLIVDASQGVEAQTVSNLYLALEADLTIIPILNKIDMPNSDVEAVSEQIIELIGCDKSEILTVSAKEGTGVDSVFDSIVNVIPPPTKNMKMVILELYFDSLLPV